MVLVLKVLNDVCYIYLFNFIVISIDIDEWIYGVKKFLL